jgi:hypothetical protein
VKDRRSHLPTSSGRRKLQADSSEMPSTSPNTERYDASRWPHQAYSVTSLLQFSRSMPAKPAAISWSAGEMTECRQFAASLRLEIIAPAVMDDAPFAGKAGN